MSHAVTVMLAMAAAVSPLLAPARQSETGLTLRAVRFYRGDQQRTRVKGLVQIPLALLQPAAGSGGQVSYAVSVRVADSTGLTLYQQAWRNRASIPAAPVARDAYTVEIVDFVVAPGVYRLEVGVEDSVSGRTQTAAVAVTALSEGDVASDLLLSPAIRLASAGDTVPRPGEFRLGNNLVTAAAHVELTPLRPAVSYLLEVYSERADSGTMGVALRDSAGKPVVATETTPVAVTAGGSILKGQLDLAGLPAGTYTLVASLRLGGQTVERSARLTMEPLGETLAKDTARRNVERVGDPGYFAAMSAQELNQAAAPIAYVAESREMAPWTSDLSTEAKRRFLAEFWQRRDPTPGTARNERRDAFYEAIAYANRTYAESGRTAIPGWRSDRGRIYIRNGRPGDVLRRQQEGRAPPYEVWSYAKGKGLYYIFADRTGFGSYTLIHSNDLKEPGLPGWGDIIGRTAMADAGRFLGVDLFASGRRF